MKKALLGILAALSVLTPCTMGQGQFVFVNRMVGFFDVPVYLPASEVGAGTLGDVRAQLWTADGAIMLSETTFRATSGIQAAYLLAKDVVVEGNTGTPMDVELRFLLDGVRLTGDGDFVFEVTPAVAPNPPSRIGGYEGGLNGGVDGPLIIPEPSTLVLAGLGIGALLLRRRKK